MKQSTSWKKTLAMIAVAFGIAAGMSVAAPQSAEAYYADTSSAVYYGSDYKGDRYYAINVVDDDGTVYTFQYRGNRSEPSYRIAGESEWHYWPMGKGMVYSHIEKLASAGFFSLKENGFFDNL